MKPIHFEVITYLTFGLALGLLGLFGRKRRDYWYALFGCGLLFPFEWIGFRTFTFLDYDLRFTMLFDRLPLMIPFAWAWFMGGTLIVCLLVSKTLNSMPLSVQIVVLYAIFWLFDLAVEYSSVGNNLWVYHWPTRLMLGGRLPWLIPTFVAAQNVGNYFAHGVALRRSEEAGLLPGFLIHLAAYYAVNSLVLVGGGLLYWALGITAVPFGRPSP